MVRRQVHIWIGQKIRQCRELQIKALCSVLTCVAGKLSMKLADLYLPIIVTDCVSTTFRVWPMILNCQLKRNRGVQCTSSVSVKLICLLMYSLTILPAVSSTNE